MSTHATRETTADVVVVDYGLGNLRSVTRGLERAGAAVEISDDSEALDEADGVVLPGVGAFGDGMENAGPFREALRDVADSDTPLFGICLGMQMLLDTSEEADREGQGDVEGLGLIPGTNVRFDDPDLKVPHMGWNELHVERDHPLVAGVDSVASETRPADGTGGSVDGEYAYFVHSYYAEPEDENHVVATTDYGTDFASVVANDDGTVFGTQFHPEKSGETGLRILRNYVDLCAKS
ncbi:imidazole glycerol phosphate synthase subunit HisH [Halarchaeum salinum]|uniref:Imidazole glycerol phosphate synthase subunit HisH n=1 Tax=Halarchaeum salinum TaxID=489912 RepID=A0AAV3S5E0_9EURY